MRAIETTAELGSTIRQVRKELKLNQTDLAKKAGCSQRFISELERGKQTAELGKTLDVLSALGLGIQLIPSEAAKDQAFQGQMQAIVESIFAKNSPAPKLADILKDEQ